MQYNVISVYDNYTNGCRISKDQEVVIIAWIVGIFTLKSI